MFGVYGLYIDNELIYIGYTKLSFESRFEGHNDPERQGNPHLKELIGQFEMRPLITFDESVRGFISRDILLALESHLIISRNPKYNIYNPSVERLVQPNSNPNLPRKMPEGLEEPMIVRVPIDTYGRVPGYRKSGLVYYNKALIESYFGGNDSFNSTSGHQKQNPEKYFPDIPITQAKEKE